MKLQKVTSAMCRGGAGILGFALTGYGVYSFLIADFRRDKAVTFLFCLMPTLTLPAVLLTRQRMWWAVFAHSAMAAVYLTVFSMLDWRSCAELGICSGVQMTVKETLATRPMEALLAVAVLQFFAAMLKGRRG
jgi:hypothetical protein